MRNNYAPSGRTEVGVCSLPNGDTYYAFLVKQRTTTNLTPEQIHQLGLAQVKQIEEYMLAVANQLGYKDLKSFNAAIAADPKLNAHSRQQILDLYRKYIDQMYSQLPQQFGHLPKAKLEVLPVEEFREKEESAAQYYPPAMDGSRPAPPVCLGPVSRKVTLKYSPHRLESDDSQPVIWPCNRQYENFDDPQSRE